MNTNESKSSAIKKIVFFIALACLVIGLAMTRSDSSSAQSKAEQGRGRMDGIPLKGPLQGGSGEQQGRVKQLSEKAGSHLHLVLQLTQDGEIEVIKATEVPGEAPLSDVPTGGFVYEVLDNDEPVAVEAVTDPFELRSFSGPEDSETHGHYIGRAETATIVVKVPKASLDNVKLDKLSIRFYRLKPEVNLEKIDVTELHRLKQEDQLESLMEVTGSKLAPEIKLKGLRLGIR